MSEEKPKPVLSPDVLAKEWAWLADAYARSLDVVGTVDSATGRVTYG